MHVDCLCRVRVENHVIGQPMVCGTAKMQWLAYFYLRCLFVIVHQNVADSLPLPCFFLFLLKYAH